MTKPTEKQEVFEFNGAFYSIPIDPQESREMYIERVWFILAKLAKLAELSNVPDEIDKLILQSRCWSNTKYLGCVY